MSGSMSSHGDQSGQWWKSLMNAWTTTASTPMLVVRTTSNAPMPAVWPRSGRSLKATWACGLDASWVRPPSVVPVDPVKQLAWGDVEAALFDLDGVVTPTAEVHMRAWEEMFNAFLESYSGPGDRAPYTDSDYFAHVDGKPRYDGVRDFLTARGIDLPEGTNDDPASAVTVRGLGNRKNDAFNEVLARDGV